MFTDSFLERRWCRRMSRKRHKNTLPGANAGFSMLELLIVIAVMAIVAAMAIPSWQRMQKNARLTGDGHNLASTLSVAKMRAAADFTQSRLFFFTGTDKKQYFRVDVWNKTANGGTAGCWVPDAVTNPATNGNDCIANTSYKGSENYLSTGVSAGYGSLSTSPFTSLTMGQASACKQGGTTPTSGTDMSNTSCILFNSRGFPTTSAGVTSAAGIYITDGTRVYGITTNAMGLVHSYVTPASSANWYAY